MDIPAFHPEWLVTFWLTTPGLNVFNPHLLLILFMIVLIGIYYFKRKRKGIPQPDSEEMQFKHLLAKKTVIENELGELKREYEAGKLEGDQYMGKEKELQKHLDLTKRELKQFTI